MHLELISRHKRGPGAARNDTECATTHKKSLLSQELTVPIKSNTFLNMPNVNHNQESDASSAENLFFSVEKKSQETELTKNPNYPKHTN